jgi:hypothetical protein
MGEVMEVMFSCFVFDFLLGSGVFIVIVQENKLVDLQNWHHLSLIDFWVTGVLCENSKYTCGHAPPFQFLFK